VCLQQTTNLPTQSPITARVDKRARTALAYRHAPVDPLGCVGDDSAYKLGTATRGQRDATNMPAAGLTPCPEPGPVIFAE
jgi:hypothetical protein